MSVHKDSASRESSGTPAAELRQPALQEAPGNTVSLNAAEETAVINQQATSQTQATEDTVSLNAAQERALIHITAPTPPD